MKTTIFKKITLFSSLLPLLLLTNSFTQAEEGIIPKLKEYDIEIIIFEDAHARYINSEYWHSDTITAMPDTESVEQVRDTKENNIKTEPADSNQADFKSIKPVILNNEYKRINNSKEYKVLFYGSWRQAGLDDKKAFDIDIKTLENTHKTTSENTLSGTFKLELSRYLHLYGDMEYQRKIEATETTTDSEPVNPGMSNQVTGTEKGSVLENLPYPIQIHRRMRSKELHYIDHPLIGMLVQINPVEPSKEETAETSTTP